MPKIDRLLGDVLQAQAKVTHSIFCDVHERARDIHLKNKRDAVNALLMYVHGLEKQLEELTPHPDDDTEK